MIGSMGSTSTRKVMERRGKGRNGGDGKMGGVGDDGMAHRPVTGPKVGNGGQS